MILGFVLFTIVGTVSHEIGHWFTATILGMKAEVKYSSTHFVSVGRDKMILMKRELLLILISGPLQTMLVGSFGLLCLWKNRF